MSLSIYTHQFRLYRFVLRGETVVGLGGKVNVSSVILQVSPQADRTTVGTLIIVG